MNGSTHITRIGYLAGIRTTEDFYWFKIFFKNIFAMWSTVGRLFNLQYAGILIVGVLEKWFEISSVGGNILC